MAFLRKPQEEEEGQGQTTSFASQGPGMVGAGGGEGGLGVAGGSPTGRTPFINPEEFTGQNVQAGQRLARRLGETFTKPAEQISKQIGTERQAFEQQAKASPVSFDDNLLARTKQAPSLLGEDVAKLKERYGTQYQGPMQFQASEKITDPMAKLQERIKTYGSQGGPGTGIHQEGLRQSLIGEIMKPTSTGGKRSLEEQILTSQPQALDTLSQIISRTGRLGGEAPTSTLPGMQPISAPVDRLEQARKEMADLVQARQKAAEETRRQTGEAIRGGIGKIEGDVRTSIDDAIAASQRRKELMPELFRGDYTKEEQDLAKRLGVSDEQQRQAQSYMDQLLNPYEAGLFGEDWEEQGYTGEEISGLDYSQVDPLSTIFSYVNPETVYTQEQMITPEQASALGQLQEIIGASPSITRAEDALGGAGRSIQTGNVEDWLGDLAGVAQSQRELGEQRLSERAQAEVKAKVGPPPERTGNYEADKQSYLEWRENLENAAREEKALEESIAKYDKYQAGIDDYAKGVEEGKYPYDQQIVDELRKVQGEDPGLLARMRNQFMGSWSQAELAREQQRQVTADRERKAALDKIRNPQNYGVGSPGSYRQGGRNYGATRRGRDSAGALSKSGRMKGQSGR
jgi:hypothetical protein